MYTLKEAAEATGKGKPAILKAIQRGRISARKNEFGEWTIDPSELHRVYPPVSLSGSSDGQGERWETEKIRLLEQQIEWLKATNRDMQEDRDHWRKQAQQATALLTHQPEPAKAPETSADPPRLSLVEKLFGRRS